MTLDWLCFTERLPEDHSVGFGNIRIVSGIQETSDGSLWFAESQGIVHIPESEVRRSLSRLLIA